jgi:hypothetical protein
MCESSGWVVECASLASEGFAIDGTISPEMAQFVAKVNQDSSRSDPCLRIAVDSISEPRRRDRPKCQVEVASKWRSMAEAEVPA